MTLYEIYRVLLKRGMPRPLYLIPTRGGEDPELSDWDEAYAIKWQLWSEDLRSNVFCPEHVARDLITMQALRWVCAISKFHTGSDDIVDSDFFALVLSETACLEQK